MTIADPCNKYYSLLITHYSLLTTHYSKKEVKEKIKSCQLIYPPVFMFKKLLLV
ncbi:MAG: hypothetical protein F6K47_42230 [Symploca sp. SIO2E6]|nr:hypothetical protein [Symploca sp. SIO2E6]